MRKFHTAMNGVVDLDDEKIYSYLPDNTEDLDNLMFREIGQALVYVKYFHPDWCKKQRKRINILIKEFATNRKHNYKNKKWYKEQVFKFQEETENMC